MCDIWKDNKNLKQLTESDISGLLTSLKELGTRQVVMSGGEALLNANFFTLCRLLKEQGISICLLSTGLLLKKYVADIIAYIDEVIISLDGDEPLHDAIRNLPGAYHKLREGIEAIRSVAPKYKITGRSVIHKLNYNAWPLIINSAKALRLNQISFLPADVSSQAFNRETPWDAPRQAEVMLSIEDLPELKHIIDNLLLDFREDFNNGFIAESPEKISNIYAYYSALYGLNAFPYKKCNAPWVSAVVEADGAVRPCFFLPAFDNIRNHSLKEILNSPAAIQFRKGLDMDNNSTCKSCVCYLNLKPHINPVTTN
jgi:MoaA/NifB/PqqE/SkfB family radical SAM enzyme